MPYYANPLQFRNVSSGNAPNSRFFPCIGSGDLKVCPSLGPIRLFALSPSDLISVYWESVCSQNKCSILRLSKCLQAPTLPEKKNKKEQGRLFGKYEKY